VRLHGTHKVFIVQPEAQPSQLEERLVGLRNELVAGQDSVSLEFNKRDPDTDSHKKALL
jgi:hypothetical protein